MTGISLGVVCVTVYLVVGYGLGAFSLMMWMKTDGLKDISSFGPVTRTLCAVLWPMSVMTKHQNGYKTPPLFYFLDDGTEYDGATTYMVVMTIFGPLFKAVWYTICFITLLWSLSSPCLSPVVRLARRVLWGLCVILTPRSFRGM